MPPITAPAKVLVTGANGFVAIYVVKYLLERGFHVRGTVRSTEKGEYVKKVVDNNDRFEYVVVSNVNDPGAYDEAVKGVAAIQSVAAPLPSGGIDDPDHILKPAVEGTIALLESARKAGTVKRVVITSSLIAEVEPKETKHHYTENDWHDQCLTLLEQLGPKTPSVVVYGASKVLVERAAFDYVKKHEGAINFDVVTLLPPYAFGPPLNEMTPNVEPVFTSLGAFAGGLTGHPSVPEWFQPEFYVDVRDAAEIHVRAILKEAAGNERINVIAGTFTWERAFKALNLPADKRPKDVTPKHTYDNSKSIKLLDFEYRPLEETVKDSWAEFQKRGWVTTDGRATW